MPAREARSCAAARYAMEVASSAGWAFSVRLSRSSGPSKASVEMGSPRASSAVAKIAAAAGDDSARALPIPTDWEPWPGKTYAKVVIDSEGVWVAEKLGAPAACHLGPLVEYSVLR